MEILKIDNLKKQYGDFFALKDISLKVEVGVVCGFIGPNGAGKTTTIRTILGMIKASEGSVKIFGQDAWRDIKTIHKRIAYVPGDINLWPDLTGGEVIDLLLNLQGNYDNNKKKKLIDSFDLDVTKKCRAYSKGNRQKVALISAFASNAELFILDEPTSGLDPLMEEKFKECVQEVKNEGKTVLLSSHILSEVETLCDYLYIIRAGKIIDSGTLSELRHLSRTNMKVAAKKELTELNSFKGLYNLTFDNHYEASFQVDNDKIGEIVNLLSKYHIQNLESTPPTLEDLFMNYYQVD